VRYCPSISWLRCTNRTAIARRGKLVFVPRLCTICEHPEQNRIDLALRDKQPQEYVAKWYNVTRDAIGRHVRSGHMIRTEPRPASSDARPLSAIREESSNTVEKLRELVLVARGILDSAVGTNQLVLIGLFQQTTTCSVAGCRGRFFRRRCKNSSRSLPVRRPAKSIWAPVAGRMGSYVRDARTGGPIG
jgi:hypothetical protein